MDLTPSGEYEMEVGKVIAMAVRTKVGGPMREISEATAIVDSGLDVDIPVSSERGITFLSNEQWKTVTDELAADLPWHTRRANVLVDCESLGHLLGKSICVGEVVVDIKAETDPCQMMEDQHAGLLKALVPDLRGGVYGRVTRGGKIKVGDMIAIQAEVASDSPSSTD